VIPASGAPIPIARDQKREKGKINGIAGKKIGPYVVQRPLAKGGMGQVLLAEDPMLRRIVAIKLLELDLVTDLDAQKRFEREARAAAAIAHPHVASILSVGVTKDSVPYLAMEYLEGGSLLDTLRNRTPLSFSQIAALMEQVASALRAALRVNIIHRDIKPANIMLTRDGDAKVVDFGLAKIFFEDSYRTTDGTVLGTPSYMAPEQGKGQSVDHRADIYSFGATFYHIITGRPPFTGDSPVQIMMKHATAPVIPLRTLNKAVPLEMDDVVMKCLRKDPGERYQDYGSLLSDIKQLRLMLMAREQSAVLGGGQPGGQTSMLPPPPSMGPGATGAPAARPLPDYIPMNAPQEEAGLTPGKLAILIGAALVVLAGIVLAFLPRGGDDDSAEPGGRKITIIMGGEQNGTAPPVDPMTREYNAAMRTKDILESLDRGLVKFELENGRLPDELSQVSGEEWVLVNFETDAAGTPLDAWGTPVLLDRGARELRSAGLDKSPRTDDDLVLLHEGAVAVPTLYQVMAPP
jgi:tRNA A-37 threonylcarbamoyl transferase component Bud32